MKATLIWSLRVSCPFMASMLISVTFLGSFQPFQTSYHRYYQCYSFLCYLYSHSSLDINWSISKKNSFSKRKTLAECTAFYITKLRPKEGFNSCSITTFSSGECSRHSSWFLWASSRYSRALSWWWWVPLIMSIVRLIGHICLWKTTRWRL